MFRNTQTNSNSRAIERYCSLEYIHPTNPSKVIQTVDNLEIRQNYGPINCTHFAGQIYHNKNSKIRVFPTVKQLRNQKDKYPKYDDRSKIGKEMTSYLIKNQKSDVNTGWSGYQTEPEREILSYDRAVKSLNNIRFSVDPSVTIFQDIKRFFTRFCKEGEIIDTMSLADFSDLEGVLVDKELNKQKMLNSPAQFISELRYNVFHGYDASKQNASRTSLPLSENNTEPPSVVDSDDSVDESPAVLECLMISNDLNDAMTKEILSLRDQLSDEKEKVFIKESTIHELRSVVSAVLEVTKSSLEKNNSKQSDITVYDRIFNFKSGIRSQVYKFRENKNSDKEVCGCFQCELQQVCTRTQKIIEIGLENCNIKPIVFAFGKNVDGHVCEPTEKNPKNIELTEITSLNKLGSKNLQVPEENLSVSVNICSHESRDGPERQIAIDNKQSTPIKPQHEKPKVLVPADVDDTAEITRPEYPGSDASSQLCWSDVVSTHEEFLSDFMSE